MGWAGKPQTCEDSRASFPSSNCEVSRSGGSTPLSIPMGDCFPTQSKRNQPPSLPKAFVWVPCSSRRGRYHGSSTVSCDRSLSSCADVQFERWERSDTLTLVASSPDCPKTLTPGGRLLLASCFTGNWRHLQPHELVVPTQVQTNAREAAWLFG